MAPANIKALSYGAVQTCWRQCICVGWKFTDKECSMGLRVWSLFVDGVEFVAIFRRRHDEKFSDDSKYSTPVGH